MTVRRQRIAVDHVRLAAKEDFSPTEYNDSGQRGEYVQCTRLYGRRRGNCFHGFVVTRVRSRPSRLLASIVDENER